MVRPLAIKKADFLSTNNDFGLGAAREFSEMLKGQGVQELKLLVAAENDLAKCLYEKLGMRTVGHEMYMRL